MMEQIDTEQANLDTYAKTLELYLKKYKPHTWSDIRLTCFKKNGIINYTLVIDRRDGKVGQPIYINDYYFKNIPIFIAFGRIFLLEK